MPAMMTRLERAKQFMPFDAMKGLQEALRDREERHTRVERRELSEETRRELDRALHRVQRGTLLQLTVYRAFHELTLRGTVTEMNVPRQYLLLGDEKIFFEDIYGITFL